MKNNKIIFGIALLLFISLIGIGSATEQSYCCEKTSYGAYCQNEPLEKCESSINSLTNEPYKTAPTSCESTSYCKLGTCVNNQEGICFPNVPEMVCSKEGGYWEDKVLDEMPQCQLGCCLLGDQAAFVTQTRCSTLSSIYGLEIDYRRDIQNEVQCIANANPGVEGACVFEENYVNSCTFITKKECQAIDDANFHEGYLCSAESLATICGPKGGTTCHDEKVYFLDNCGNLANVYDNSKINDANYWTYVQEPTCDDGNGNKNSKVCGDCDYFSGSTCKSYRQANSASPNYGDYICNDLDCEYESKPYSHGERWCVTSNKKGLDENLPGTEDFMLECRDGEVLVESCSIGEYRNKICIESEVSDFKTARCSVNLWQNCIEQETQEDCLDVEKRDCEWIEKFSILKDDDGEEMKLENLAGKEVRATCVPKYSPAFNFWEPGSEAESWCSLANNLCLVEMEIGPYANRARRLVKLSDKIDNCVGNCYCLEGYDSGEAKRRYEKEDHEFNSYQDWISTMDQICTSIGDCGITTNYLGKDGYFEEAVIEAEFFVNPKALEEYGN